MAKVSQNIVCRKIVLFWQKMFHVKQFRKNVSRETILAECLGNEYELEKGEDETLKGSTGRYLRFA